MKSTLQNTVQLVAQQKRLGGSQGSRPITPAEKTPTDNRFPLQIQQQRFALGEIDEIEYQHKLNLLDLQPESSFGGMSIGSCQSCGEQDLPQNPLLRELWFNSVKNIIPPYQRLYQKIHRKGVIGKYPTTIPVVIIMYNDHSSKFCIWNIPSPQIHIILFHR